MTYQYVGPTPHCLRASTVVFYRESGMSDPEIMAITGHESPKSFLGYSRTHVENVKVRMDAAEQSRKRSKRTWNWLLKQPGITRLAIDQARPYREYACYR